MLLAGLVGSYSQPAWLINRHRLGERLPPRVRARELWQIPPEHLEEAWQDATLNALHDQVRAGVDFVTDGEIRRESYSNRFSTSLSGVDLDRPGEALDRTGKTVTVPRVTGPLVRERAVETDYVALLKQHTDKPVKVTLPGPFTMTQQACNDHYTDDATLAEAYARVVNEEVLALFEAGADIVNSMSHTCRRGRMRLVIMRSPLSTLHWHRHPAPPCSTSVSVTESTWTTSRMVMRFSLNSMLAQRMNYRSNALSRG